MEFLAICRCAKSKEFRFACCVLRRPLRGAALRAGVLIRVIFLRCDPGNSLNTANVPSAAGKMKTVLYAPRNSWILGVPPEPMNSLGIHEFWGAPPRINEFLGTEYIHVLGTGAPPGRTPRGCLPPVFMTSYEIAGNPLLIWKL